MKQSELLPPLHPSIFVVHDKLNHTYNGIQSTRNLSFFLVKTSYQTSLNIIIIITYCMTDIVNCAYLPRNKKLCLNAYTTQQFIFLKKYRKYSDILQCIKTEVSQTIILLLNKGSGYFAK